MFMDYIPFAYFKNEEELDKFREVIKGTIFDIEMEYDVNNSDEVQVRFSETDQPEKFRKLYRDFIVKNDPDILGYVVLNKITRELAYYSTEGFLIKEIQFEELDEWYGIEEDGNKIDFHLDYDEELTLSVYLNEDYSGSTTVIDVEIVDNENDFEYFKSLN
jgi:hypothetical protein